MDNTSIWISLAALTVSVGTFLHTIFRSVSQSQIEVIEERSDLLTKIVELKLEYEQEVNHLSWLAEVSHRYKLPDSNELTRMVIRYREYILLTQEHYDNLIGMSRPSKAMLADMKHHIDALRVRVGTETKRLEIQKEQIQSILDTHHEEKA